MPSSRFRVLLSDIGGVLGTNGWDSSLRRRACEHFGIAPDSIESRHRLLFDTYERGFMNLDSYLTGVFFHQPRPFRIEELREFILEGSVPWFENIDFLHDFRCRHQLKMGLVSNEGEGITGHRIHTFKLRELADFMVVSHFVHMRKPDPAIWRLALDLAGARPEEAIYIDDRPVFAEIASDLGLTGLHYTSLPELKRCLSALGFDAG